MAHSPEVQPSGGENLKGLEAAASEQAEALKNNLEKTGEHSPEKQAEMAEKARSEANKEALLSKEVGGAEKKSGGEPTAAPKRKQITKTEKAVSYKQTMQHVQSELSQTERAFSKVIHNPIVERTSDLIGSTVARPNAILSGSITAFILVLALYITARTMGFTLSGFETIGAFIIGWIIGILFDFLRTMITGKRT
ncbi:MAG: hypothetical protein ACMG55_19325 [Microcoleus sp.]